MNNRKAIFSLIAMGRITPAQAERLLAVSSESGETLLALAAYIIALLLMQTNAHGLSSAISHPLRSLHPAVTMALHSAQHIVTQLFGGIQ
jgi:hypothetical protein